VGVEPFRSEVNLRGARMLRTALGPAIGAWLEDPAIVEAMLNPDGQLWVDRLAGGGLPVGLSFIGPAWSEARLLGFGYAYEARTHRRRPPTYVRFDALPAIAPHVVPSSP
jgi:type IV secretion system protein VirB11